MWVLLKSTLLCLYYENVWIWYSPSYHTIWYDTVLVSVCNCCCQGSLGVCLFKLVSMYSVDHAALYVYVNGDNKKRTPISQRGKGVMGSEWTCVCVCVCGRSHCLTSLVHFCLSKSFGEQSVHPYMHTYIHAYNNIHAYTAYHIHTYIHTYIHNTYILKMLKMCPAPPPKIR